MEGNIGKNIGKAATIQYLLVGGGPHGAEILNRHRFQTMFFKRNLFKR